MLIYNTTFAVENNTIKEWQKWVKEHHISFMKESGNFSEPQLVKVLAAMEEGYQSFALQFKIDNVESLENWKVAFENSLSKEIYTNFGEKVLLFSTTMELIDL